jgi:hypothetical protein
VCSTLNDSLNIWKYILGISFILSSYASVLLRNTPTCTTYWQFVSKNCLSSSAINVNGVRENWYKIKLFVFMCTRHVRELILLHTFPLQRCIAHFMWGSFGPRAILDVLYCIVFICIHRVTLCNNGQVMTMYKPCFTEQPNCNP